MNVVDICIIILLLFGFFIGWKRGFTKQLVSIVGIIFALVFSFVFKDYISTVFYRICPFFNFGGYFKDVTALNLIIYELLAFLILFSLLLLVYKIVVKLSSFIEKLLNATIILGIPGKLLGGLAGVIENFLIIYIVLFILSLPILDFPYVKQSKISAFVLNDVPIISNICRDTLEIYNEIAKLKEEHGDDVDKSELNNNIVNLLIEHKFVSKENVEYLIEDDKLKDITIEN